MRFGELIGEKTDGLKNRSDRIRAGMTTMVDDGVAKFAAGSDVAGGNCSALRPAVR